MSKKAKFEQQLKARRKKRVRAKIYGTKKNPRLNVFRSLKHIYAQLIDDDQGLTIAAAKDLEVKGAKGKKTDLAFAVGQLIAAKAVKLGISEVVFDRSSFQYHGRVKAVAEGARKGGLKF